MIAFSDIQPPLASHPVQANGAGHRASLPSRRRPPAAQASRTYSRPPRRPPASQVSRTYSRPPRRPPARGGPTIRDRSTGPARRPPRHCPAAAGHARHRPPPRPPARGGPTIHDRSTSGTTASSIVGPPLAGGLRRPSGNASGGGPTLRDRSTGPAGADIRTYIVGPPLAGGLLPLACDARWPAPTDLRAAVAVPLTTIYLLLHQSPQNGLQDAAVFVVGDVDGAVEAGNGGEGKG